MRAAKKQQFITFSHDLLEEIPKHGKLLIFVFILLLTIVFDRGTPADASSLPLGFNQMVLAAGSIDKYTPTIQEDSSYVTMSFADETGGGYLIKPQVATSMETVTRRLDEIEYEVKKGDTLSTIANHFGLSVATILENNNIPLDKASQIAPGTKLKISPENTSTSLAWLEKEKEIKEKARQEAEKRRQLASANRAVATRNSRGGLTKLTAAERQGSNPYPYGWCTWWAAQKRNIPAQWGNAKNWLSSAQRSGWSTGSEPQAGAIAVTAETWLGHVAYVESIDGDSVTLSEMNYKGWGVVSSRTISANSSVIRGYIY